MSYATTTDVQDRMTSTMTQAQLDACSYLLDDAALLIDAYAPDASDEAKLAVSCSMVIRAIGTAGDVTVPLGASQGSVSALGYSQSWTIPNGGTGELYMTKAEKKILGVGNLIGSYSPLEDIGGTT